MIDLDTVTNSNSLKNNLYFLLMGQALNGFAGTCFYTIGITFLDESVPTKSSALYIGQLPNRPD